MDHFTLIYENNYRFFSWPLYATSQNSLVLTALLFTQPYKPTTQTFRIINCSSQFVTISTAPAPLTNNDGTIYIILLADILMLSE
jgi:hypothetical protein